MSDLNNGFFTAEESTKFSFFRISKDLFISPAYQDMSMYAKLLYGMVIDRMELSKKNDWIDEEGRVYIEWRIRAMYNANGGKVASIAKALGIDKARVRRVLLIHGDLKTARTSVMYALYKDGASKDEIAQILNVSTATVARALPYRSDEKREGRGER